MAVIAAGELHDFRAAGEAARQPQRAHRRFGAARAEAHAFDRRHHRDHELGELASRLRSARRTTCRARRRRARPRRRSGARARGSAAPTTSRSRCRRCRRRRRACSRRPSFTNTGVPPTERNARTGEFTPPGITRLARSNAAAERSWFTRAPRARRCVLVRCVDVGEDALVVDVDEARREPLDHHAQRTVPGRAAPANLRAETLRARRARRAARFAARPSRSRRGTIASSPGWMCASSMSMNAASTNGASPATANTHGVADLAHRREQARERTAQRPAVDDGRRVDQQVDLVGQRALAREHRRAAGADVAVHAHQQRQVARVDVEFPRQPLRLAAGEHDHARSPASAQAWRRK